jgi:hypothetical protein
MPFIKQTNILPRQARDKHRESTQTREPVFSSGGVSTSAHPRAGKKTRLFAKVKTNSKMDAITLPREARDKYRESTQNRDLCVFPGSRWLISTLHCDAPPRRAFTYTWTWSSPSRCANNSPCFLLWSHFWYQKRLVYPDRLGTDIGYVENKEVLCLQAAVVSPPDHTAQGDHLAAEIVCECGAGRIFTGKRTKRVDHF